MWTNANGTTHNEQNLFIQSGIAQIKVLQTCRLKTQKHKVVNIWKGRDEQKLKSTFLRVRHSDCQPITPMVVLLAMDRWDADS